MVHCTDAQEQLHANHRPERLGWIKQQGRVGEMNLIEEAIKGYWGERCPDRHTGCPACKAWGEFDVVVAIVEMVLRDAKEKVGVR
jgi:hypothetical protein